MSNFDTSDVTSMYEMFSGCSDLTNLDLSSFDTSNITMMDKMFSGCSDLTSLDLSNFNTSNVTDMRLMLAGCASLTTLDLSSFNTSNVTDMWGMFKGCSGLTTLDLSNFNTTNVKFMREMFYNCSGLTTLDLSSFNTSNVTDMGYMFYDCGSLTTLDLSSFNTSNVTDMRYMFSDCSGLTTLDLSGFDTSSVRYITNILSNCTNLEELKTPGNNAVVITLPHKMYDRSGTEYNEIPILTKSVELSKTQAGEDPGFIVCDGVKATFDVATGELVFDSDGGTLCRDWIQRISISKSDIKIIKAKNIFSRIVLPADSSSLFDGFDNLIKLDLSCFDTSNVTNMNTMFKGCSSLTYLNLNNMNMSNVQMMNGMFNGCRNIKRVDLPVSVTKLVNGMFSGCNSLTDIYFNGTDEQWNNVSKEDQSIPESVTVHFSATRVAASQTHYSSDIYYGGTGLGKTNEEQIREYYRQFASTIDSYMNTLKDSVKAEANTNENVLSLREVDEAKKQPALTIPGTVTSNSIIDAAYAGLAEFYNRFDNDHPALAKINLSLSMTEIESKIITEISRSFKTYQFSMNHNGRKVECNISSEYNAFFGSITVEGIRFTVVSDNRVNANTMAEYLKILNERAEQVSKDGLKEYMKIFNKETCITSITEQTFTGLFNKIYDYMLDKGYGKVTKYSAALYRGYKITKDVTALKNGELSDKLKNSLSLYDQIKNMSFSDSSIRNEALKTSLQNVESARARLENALYNYTYHPDEALNKKRGWFEKFTNGFKRYIGKCPVDFTIYDENGNILGWTNGSYCEFDEPIYIEMSGDVENIYIPDDIQVNVVATATGDGSMSYMVEQYNGETIIGRLNYYDVPLTEGESYTQSLPAGSIIDESITLVGSEGSEISGSEYIDANTDAICSVSCDVCDGGEIYGAGEYVRGDYAELIAFAESGYSFAGWYIDDVLVSCDEVYRCAVTGDLSIYASFTEMENPQEITCEEKVIKKVGDEPFSLNASTSGNSTLYYYSENEEVATVSDDGMVSILNAGDTLIYVIANATNEYESSIKTISLTVIEANEYIDVSELTISLSKSSYTYNGNARKPGVIVKNGDLVLTAGSDYTVSYANNVNAGTASVTVTGTGWYTGEKTLTFQIKKASPKLVFAESEIRKSTQDSAFTNGLTKTTDGTVSFSSGNKSVATVNATSGKVTIKGPGTTTITVNAAEGSNYKAGSSSYTLTVTGPLEILSISDNYYGKNGTTAAFHIEAAGTGDLSYQWQYRMASMSDWKSPAQASAKTADYSFNMKLSYDNIEVRCIVSDGSGNEVISETRKANIFAYTSQPADATAAEGQVVNFTVSALGRGVTYQWYYMRPNGVWSKTTVAGSRKAVLPITAGVNNNGTSYRCVITDEEGNQITSAAGTLTVQVPLRITGISDDAYAMNGKSVNFHVDAVGEGTLNYQWQYRMASMSEWKAPGQASAKTPDYSFNMKPSYDNIEVRCKVSDGSGNQIISETRKANIFAYTSQPTDATAAEGQVVNFTVSALGRGVTYQWYYMRPNGVWSKTTISGSKKAVLPITAGVNNNGTSYRCVITDEEGNQITSAAGVLTLDTSLRITGISEDAYDVNGESVTFHIDAVGKGTLSYQWQYKLAGETKWRTPGQASAKTADYVFKLKPSYDNIEVRCIVTDASGDTCTSDVRKANVFAITKQPNTVYAESGDSVTFAVEGIGQNLTYQWYYRRLDGDWKKVTAAGYNTASLTITAQVKNNGSQYRCYVYDGVGNLIKSRAAMLIERNEEYEG